MRRGSLRLALAYARWVPFPQRKWRICLYLLRLGGIHPWSHRDAWGETVRQLEPRVRTIRGFRMKCGWLDSTDVAMTLTGDHQPYETDVLERLLRTGDTVVDGGANVGFYTLLFASRVGPTGRVYAYEPVSSAADKLRENVELNRDLEKAPIVFRQCGLGRHPGVAPIYLRPAVSGEGVDSQHSSILPDFNTPAVDAIVEEIEIVRLDDERIDSRIDLVKCDIEGAERDFLEGARKRIAADLPLLVLEWNPSPETYSVESILELIEALGDYSIFPMRRGRLFRASRTELETFRGDVVCATPEHVSNRLRTLLHRPGDSKRALGKRLERPILSAAESDR